MRTRRGVNVPLSGGGNGSLSNDESFSHPATERCRGGTGLGRCREMLGKHIGHRRRAGLRPVCEVAVEFDVMRGGFTDLACTHADDAVVGVHTSQARA